MGGGTATIRVLQRRRAEDQIYHHRGVTREKDDRRSRRPAARGKGNQAPQGGHRRDRDDAGLDAVEGGCRRACGAGLGVGGDGRGGSARSPGQPGTPDVYSPSPAYSPAAFSADTVIPLDHRRAESLVLHLVQPRDRASSRRGDLVDLLLGMLAAGQQQRGGAARGLGSDGQGVGRVEADLDPALGRGANRPQEERDAAGAQRGRGDHVLFRDLQGPAHRTEDLLRVRERADPNGRRGRSSTRAPRWRCSAWPARWSNT